MVNGYLCYCKPGFTGVFCDQSINECASNPCQNGGTCIDGVGFYNCSCAPNFNGTNCELRQDKCLVNNPCLNGANCTNGLTDAAPTCTCAAGYTGPTCATYTPACDPNPCQNSGACYVNATGGASCNCTSNFTGSRCETARDFCAGVTCSGNGVCVPNPAGGNHTCTCDSGSQGLDCADKYFTCSAIGTFADPRYCRKYIYCTTSKSLLFLN